VVVGVIHSANPDHRIVPIKLARPTVGIPKPPTPQVERGAWGGTCVNVGCVPKKIMSNAANLATDLHFAGDYGFCGDSTPRFDLAALKRARDDYVKRLNAIYERNLKSAGVATFLSSASLADAHTVRLEDGTLLQVRVPATQQQSV
jgi:pyruvate/2-oxoglutarate dehydrogenase complex dihydrolipoamide dehydrogenase (E3) component